MKLVYAREKLPDSFSKSLFLVGPTPRSPEVSSWRPEMISALEESGYDGVVFIPEDREGEYSCEYTNQVEWEHDALNRSDLVLAWVPRDLDTMPAFTTNVEFGSLLTSRKLLYGRPEGAPKTRYLDYCYTKQWGREPLSSLREMAAQAVETLGEGADRSGGLCQVPLAVFQTSQFRAWYQSQKQAGNRLDAARVEWEFWVGPNKSFLFCFALWVEVWIESEQRHKSNEFIFSRPDLSTIVAYKPGQELMDTEVVLIREFRSPSRSSDGFVREVPGGSSWKDKDALSLASQEFQEETGLSVEAKRFRRCEERQMVATLSSHTACLFSVELTNEEMAFLKNNPGPFGNEEDSERTYVEIRTLKGILDNPHLDWSMVGMVLSSMI